MKAISSKWTVSEDSPAPKCSRRLEWVQGFLGRLSGWLHPRATRTSKNDSNWNLTLKPLLLILHQLVGRSSHYLKGFNHPRCRISSIHSITKWHITSWGMISGFQVPTNELSTCSKLRAVGGAFQLQYASWVGVASFDTGSVRVRPAQTSQLIFWFKAGTPTRSMDFFPENFQFQYLRESHSCLELATS